MKVSSVENKHTILQLFKIYLVLCWGMKEDINMSRIVEIVKRYFEIGSVWSIWQRMWFYFCKSNQAIKRLIHDSKLNKSNVNETNASWFG